MTDISLLWDDTVGGADWSIVNGDLQTGDDLKTAIIMSLFTDRVDPDWLDRNGNPDPRGWWGDTYSTSPIGSKLWQIAQSSFTDRNALLLRVSDICREALEWLRTDGVVNTISVSAKFADKEKISISIIATEPNQTARTYFNYSWAWQSVS